jgi:citrate lyase beta subunit
MDARLSLAAGDVDRITAVLDAAQARFAAVYPGEGGARQPVHTVYGGAHLFRADTVTKLGAIALRTLNEHAGDAATLGRIFEMGESLAERVHARVRTKLETEPVEDFRIDFEDGYGVRSADDEDGHAIAAARELAQAVAQGTAPAFSGIRVKPMTVELRGRAARTLDLFVTAMLDASGGVLPPGFVVTLPKVQMPEQVAVLADLLDALEDRCKLPAGALRIELMIEQTQAIVDATGRLALPALVRAARGRCRGAHFGTYDYLASCGIAVPSGARTMDHPACDFAKHCMQAALAGTDVWLSDGATNVLPIGDRETVHAAWRLQASHVRRSLSGGFYQGWDLHPGQLVARFSVVHAFYLEALEPAAARLAGFLAKAAQATRLGGVFDDAATGQGLLNFFLRGLAGGAITEGELGEAGVTAEELRSRSFAAIVAARSGTMGH